MVSIEELAIIILAVTAIISVGLNAFQYRRGQDVKTANAVRNVGFEVFHLRTEVERGGYGSFGGYRHPESPLPGRIIDELLKFEKILDGYNKQYRLQEDEIKLALQEAVLMVPDIPRNPAREVSQISEGEETKWQAGSSPGLKRPSDFVDQALYEVLRDPLMAGESVSVGTIRDRSPIFYSQLLSAVPAEETIGLLSTRINDNMERPHREYLRRSLEAARQRVMDFRFRTFKIQTPPRA